jgi:hypothetical protein
MLGDTTVQHAEKAKTLLVMLNTAVSEWPLAQTCSARYERLRVMQNLSERAQTHIRSMITSALQYDLADTARQINKQVMRLEKTFREECIRP